MIESNMRPEAVRLSRAAVAGLAGRFFLMGTLISSYGPLVELLSRRFGVGLPVAGATISVSFAGSLLGVFAAMRALERAPARVPVTVATAVAGAGLAAIALAPAWPLFLASVFLTGIGFGALVLALNQLVAYSEGRRRAALLNALNGFYSTGAVAGPLLVAAFAAEHFTALYLAGAALWLALVPTAVGIAGRLPVSAGPAARPGPLVAVFISGFLLYVAIENGTGGWMTAHLVSTGLGLRPAASLTSAFWLALVAGRLVVLFVPPAVSEAKIVLTGCVLATVALLAAGAGAVAPYAYVLAGLGMAPIFPTGIVWLARLRPGDSRVTSWIYPATAVGGIAGPGAIGIVIARAGVGWAPVVLAVVAAGMSAAFLLAARRSRA